MAKFNAYGMEATSEEGSPIVKDEIMALSLESAWHKAVELAFDACEPGTGTRPASIQVWRNKAPSESHG